eukprot:753523-Hanusia_phi.AAC.11
MVSGNGVASEGQDVCKESLAKLRREKLDFRVQRPFPWLLSQFSPKSGKSQGRAGLIPVWQLFKERMRMSVF